MSVDLRVEMPNLPELVGRLKAFRQDQLPFALSLAMNRAAQDAKRGVEAHMRKVFNLRSATFPRTFGPFGQFAGGRSDVVVDPKTGRVTGKSSNARAAQAIANGWSHRSQWPRLQVRLGSIAHAAALQEDGGVKPFRGVKEGQFLGPQKPAQHAWIRTKYTPMDGVRVARNYQPARVRNRLRAKRRGSKATDAVWVKGKFVMRREDGSNEVRPIYLLATRAVVPERFYFERYVVDMYNAKLWPRFSQAMSEALKNKPSSRERRQQIVDQLRGTSP